MRSRLYRCSFCRELGHNCRRCPRLNVIPAPAAFHYNFWSSNCAFPLLAAHSLTPSEETKDNG